MAGAFCASWKLPSASTRPLPARIDRLTRNGTSPRRSPRKAVARINTSRAAANGALATRASQVISHSSHAGTGDPVSCPWARSRPNNARASRGLGRTTAHTNRYTEPARTR